MTQRKFERESKKRLDRMRKEHEKRVRSKTPKSAANQLEDWQAENGTAPVALFESEVQKGE